MVSNLFSLSHELHSRASGYQVSSFPFFSFPLCPCLFCYFVLNNHLKTGKQPAILPPRGDVRVSESIEKIDFLM